MIGNTASFIVNRYGKLIVHDWLYKENWTKDDQDLFENLYNLNVFGVRPFGSYFDDVLNEKNWEMYSKPRGLTYSDIVDPRKFMNSFGQNNSTRGVVNFISKNVNRLYGD